MFGLSNDVEISVNIAPVRSENLEEYKLINKSLNDLKRARIGAERGAKEFKEIDKKITELVEKALLLR